MATRDDARWPEDHPAETLTKMAYRWNDDRGRWEFWYGGVQPWHVSDYGTDPARIKDLKDDGSVVVVAYADTWMEPSGLTHEPEWDR